MQGARGAFYRPDNSHVRSAPTKVWLHVAPNLLVIRPRDIIKQGLRAHDHPCDAISTLGGLLGQEGPLKGIHLAVGSETFDGPDLSTFDRRQRRDAGESRLPVNMYGTGATLPQSTTVLGTVEAKIAPQNIEQRRFGAGLHAVLHAIDRDDDAHGWAVSFRILAIFGAISGHGARSVKRARA